MSSSKKRRRSSLASSKVKIDVTPVLGRGLHKNIDSGLPQEQRLAQLLKACLEITVARLKAEFASEEATECLDEVLDKIPEVLQRDDMKEALYTACNMGSLLPNPDNLEMDAVIEQMLARIDRLRSEEQNWKDYLQELESQATLAESQTEKKATSVEELTPEQQALSDTYYPCTTDLDAVRRDLGNNLMKAKLLVRQHDDSVDSLSQLQLELRSALDTRLAGIYDGVTSMGSPRTNLQNLVAFPTPEPETHQ